MWSAAMNRLPSRSACVLSRFLALLGVAGSVGAAMPVQALPSAQRPSLEARVAEARRQLAEDARSADPQAIVAQANNWNNWPNFNNWANWANG
jgi:hypothetical protein